MLNYQTWFNCVWLRCFTLAGLLFSGHLTAADDRVKFGNSQWPIWSELSELEEGLFAQLDSAKQGKGDDLLRLYLVASGDVRNLRTYRQINQQLDDWLDSVKSNISQASDRLGQGERLHIAMHERFFLQENLRVNAGQGYDFDQSQLSEVFRSNKYNCISASLLYVVLAHKMGFKTLGVLLPSHAFIELQVSPDQLVEVETTSANGYNWLHDEAFYEEDETNWFGDRGLQRSTYQDYLNRERVTPFELGVQNMKNQHVRPERMDYLDRMRLVEIVSELSPLDMKSHRIRLGFYSSEYNLLKAKEDYPNLDRMYSQIAPFLERLADTTELDLETDNLLAWVNSQRVLTAINNQRGQVGVTVAQQMLLTMNPGIEDFDKIKNNLYFAIAQYVDAKAANGDFAVARQVFAGSEQQCVVETNCVGSLRQLYSQWASQYWQTENWPKAIDRYREYLDIENQGEAAELFQENMQSAYLNWSSEFLKSSDWPGAREILKQCIDSAPSNLRCQARLEKLTVHYQNQ